MSKQQTTGFYLKANAACALPRYVVSVDCETLPNVSETDNNRVWHRFRLGYAIAGRYAREKIVGKKTLAFTQPTEFWDWLYAMTGMRHTVWLVAHNAVFDMTVLDIASELTRAEISPDAPRAKRRKDDNDPDNQHSYGIICVDPPPYILGLRVAETQGRLIIVDTLNWFPAKLSELGDACGIPKLPMPAFAAPNSQWAEYCQRDCEICFYTFTHLIDWVRQQNIGMFRYTAAGQAMSAFRHRFMSHKIGFHDNDYIKQIERSACFGGRTEVFRQGRIPGVVWQLDVNALFPSIMRTEPVPTKLVRYHEALDYLELMPDLRWSDSIAEVKLQTNRALYPCRFNGRVCYPVGQFKTVLAGRELDRARRMGHIIGIKAWAEYETAIIFERYVDYFWELRQKYKAAGLKMYERFVKALMNSLYGKFGQRAPAWINCDNVLDLKPFESMPVNNHAKDERTIYRMFGWQCQRSNSEVEISKTLVAIPAFITAAARWRMDQFRGLIRTGKCYYQGVDGLLVDSSGFDDLEKCNMIRPNEIGYLRECGDADNCYIFGCADYRLGQRVIISGKASDAIDSEADNLLTRRFAAASAIWQPGRRSEIAEEKTPWARSGSYSKGVVDSEGWIHPLELACPFGENSLVSVGTATAASAKESATSA